MKIKLIAFLLTVIAVLPSQAASTVDWTFGRLFVNGSGELADGRAVYLIASTNGDSVNLTSLESSLVGMTLSQGSTFGTDLRVLGLGTPNISSFGVAGAGNASAVNISYSGNLSSGDSLGLLWIDQVDGVIGNNVKFGLYISPTLAMPTDGGNVDRFFTEEQYGGSVPDGGLTTTNITVVPEPSTLFLTAIGALALLRRKR